MPHDIRVIKASEFLRADIQGHVDLPTSKHILEQLAAAVAGHSDRDILVDIRGTEGPQLSSVELYELVQMLRQLGLGVLNKIAILRREREGFDRPRFFEMLATDRGLQVAVFEEFEPAFNWINAGSAI